MTPVQQLRARGFALNLARRGTTLSLMPAGPSFSAIVSRGSEPSGEYTLNPDQSAGDRIYIARGHANLSALAPSLVLQNVADGVEYRIRGITDSPADVCVVLEVETVVG